MAIQAIDRKRTNLFSTEQRPGCKNGLYRTKKQQLVTAGLSTIHIFKTGDDQMTIIFQAWARYD
jgi:hypothetical protein